MTKKLPQIRTKFTNHCVIMKCSSKRIFRSMRHVHEEKRNTQKVSKNENDFDKEL